MCAAELKERHGMASKLCWHICVCVSLCLCVRERVRERERESLCVSVCNATQRKEMLDTVAKESHYIKQDFPGAKWPDSELPKKFLQIPESAEVCVCVCMF